MIAAPLTADNADWTEDQVTWRHQNAATQSAWAGGNDGPLTADVDYLTPAFSHTVTKEQMNTTDIPVQFKLSPGVVQSWIQIPNSNAGLFYW